MVPPVSGRPASARDVALEALGRLEADSRFLRDVLHELFSRHGLPARDRALATQLANGAVRHRRTLRLLIGYVRGRGRRASSIQPDLLAILEVGAFQLLFLDRVPDYAAVNEAADAARRTVRGRNAGRRVAGFVNGVLRAIGRLIVGHDPDGRPGPAAVPHPEGGAVRLAESVLPDPAPDRAAFLGAAYSYPDWLVARWIRHFGDAAEDVCRWGDRWPRTIARVNPLRCFDPDGLLDRLRNTVPDLRAGPRRRTLDVSDVPPSVVAELLEGALVTVQDPSAMAAVELLAPEPHERVLDLCASPGTKTTQIAEATGDRGTVVACDRSEEKLGPLRRVVAERGLRSVRVCPVESLAAAAPDGGFDAALVDSPCSNTGVLARRVEARWRLRPGDLEELAAVQGELLDRAADRVRPGGRLVYSTCSLEPEENDEVVQALLAGRDGWALERREQMLPGPDHDGAFAALLRRAT